MVSRQFLLGLGSNKSDRMFSIQQAIQSLKKLDSLSFCSVSSVYESPFEGRASKNLSHRSKCLNCVVLMKTELNIFDLFYLVDSVQDKLSDRDECVDGEYVDRDIDIDILWYENSVIFSSHLVVPHLKMRSRPFVLYPLREVFPHFVHPETEETIDELINSLDSEQSDSICLYEKL